jgi:hypothetical protein
MLNTTANKSSVLLGDHLCSSSFEPHHLGAPGIPLSQAHSRPPQTLSQQRKTMSGGSNALLSMLSQDDFTKLKQDIHTHIEKFGGKIEEIAASEEDEADIINDSFRGGNDCG